MEQMRDPISRLLIYGESAGKSNLCSVAIAIPGIAPRT